MMYYLINELHLFEDGNGRTSRAIFEMLANKNFSFENSDTFSHDTNDIAKVDHNEFERQNNIITSAGIEIYANYYLYISLIQKGIVPHTDEYTEKIIVMTDANEVLTSFLNDNSKTLNNPVYIPDEIKQDLSQAQIEQIQNALADNNGALITTSGLTMLTMLLNNESSKYFRDFTYAEGQMFSFPVNNDTRTARNMEQLATLLKQISIQNNTVISTENIGRQVITEMSNVTLEDETEQGISGNEKDSQHSKTLDEQNISKRAKAILGILFRDFQLNFLENNINYEILFDFS